MTEAEQFPENQLPHGRDPNGGAVQVSTSRNSSGEKMQIGDFEYAVSDRYIYPEERELAFRCAKAEERLKTFACRPTAESRMGEAYPLIELGFGKIEVGEGHVGELPALIFGRNGLGTIGAPTQSNRTHEPGDWKWIPCPYGQRGDRLWVREAHAFSVCDPEGLDWRDDPSNWDVIYRADEQQPSGGWRNGEGEVIPAPWRPSIHMPRWASRITLEITGVRVERLQAISSDDACAEGIERTPHGFWSLYGQADVDCTYSPCSSYRALWSSINGAESWAANPWVWCVSFRRADQ